MFAKDPTRLRKLQNLPRDGIGLRVRSSTGWLPNPGCVFCLIQSYSDMPALTPVVGESVENIVPTRSAEPDGMENNLWMTWQRKFRPVSLSFFSFSLDVYFFLVPQRGEGFVAPWLMSCWSCQSTWSTTTERTHVPWHDVSLHFASKWGLFLSRTLAVVPHSWGFSS